MTNRRGRFVVLRHDLSGSVHWDLMLDFGEVLATWQFGFDPCGPGEGDGFSARVRRIGDHRRLYLDYEGPVSGDRGRVTRVDGGDYELLSRRADVWVLRVEGEKLSGVYELSLLAGVDDVWEWRRLED